MAQQPTDTEAARFQALHESYLGTAKIDLAHLDYQKPSAFALDERNILRLERIFENEGCLRLDAENRVPVLIGRDVLTEALQRSNISPNDLYQKTVQHLAFANGEQFEVLHGRHRLHAASRQLTMAAGRWWCADLYSIDLPEAVVCHIREQYANSKNFSDGDIYCQLRTYQLQHDLEGAGKWSARLSSGTLKDLRQMSKWQPQLQDSFDDLIPFSGLWATVELGSLHRILALHCPEEMANYLGKVHHGWSFLLLGNDDLRCLLDASTVRRLETLVPGLSRSDEEACRLMMDNRSLFPRILDDRLRAQITDRLCTYREPILSLFTFFEDTQLLELGMKPLRQLLPSRPRTSMRACLRDIHATLTGDSPVLVQTSERSTELRMCAADVYIDIAIAQLFLYAVRHFDALNGKTPKKERGKPKPAIETSLAISLSGLSKLANRLGFRSENIDTLCSQDPDLNMTKSFLLQLRPLDQYSCTTAARDRLAQQICEDILTIVTPIEDISEPVFVTDICNCPKSHRCGRPHEDDYRRDRRFLFLDNMRSPFAAATSTYLTSLAFKKFVFLAFFGTFDFLPAPHFDHTVHPTTPGQYPSPPFPDDLALPLPRRTTPREFLGNHFQSTEPFLILYDAINHSFSRFSLDADGEERCQGLTDRYQNQGVCFYTLTSPTTVRVVPYGRLWESSRQSRVLIVIPQSRESDRYVGRVLEDLLESLT